MNFVSISKLWNKLQENLTKEEKQIAHPLFQPEFIYEEFGLKTGYVNIQKHIEILFDAEQLNKFKEFLLLINDKFSLTQDHIQQATIKEETYVKKLLLKNHKEIIEFIFNYKNTEDYLKLLNPEELAIFKNKKENQALNQKMIIPTNFDVSQYKIASIDFEFDSHMAKNTFNIESIFEFGFTVMHGGIKESLHYIVEENAATKKGYKRNLQNKGFKFGDSYTISHNRLKNVIESLLKDVDILVLHCAHNEIKFLQNNNIDISSIKIYDNQIIHNGRVGQNYQPKLCDILEEFNIKNSALHNAGNDAWYTLLAFEHIVKQKLKNTINVRNNKTLSLNPTERKNTVKQSI